MRYRILLLLSALLLPSCREADGPLGGTNGKLIVSSDPQGARIFVDEEDTGLLTPDSITDIGGSHTVLALLDGGIGIYTYGARVVIVGSEPFTLNGPLTARCTSLESQGSCYNRNRQALTAGNMTVSVNALGAMFLQDGSGEGIIWPAGTNDSYVSNAMPMIAGKVDGRGVALGMYDVSILAGRPTPSLVLSAGSLRTDQRTWMVPTTTSTTLTTIRGIEVREQMVIDPTVPDVAIVRVTYRNITTSPSYQQLDVRGTALGTTGITYNDVFVGFGMDPDIGDASDDIMSYDPDRHSVFAYDANFSDARFTSGAALSPGLIGLRLLSVPNGGRMVLNGYGTQGGNGSSSDWHAGTGDESIGWSIMSGTGAYVPDDPDPNIGMLVPAESDVRMLVSAGPYTLRPSEELSIIVAIALAKPVAGTFIPAAFVAPGDPHDVNRPIMKIAAALRQKLIDAEALIPKLGSVLSPAH
ncbi:MAG: hypothetical protein ABIV28_02100 [Longimicrobiales bacterium]